MIRKILKITDRLIVLAGCRHVLVRYGWKRDSQVGDTRYCWQCRRAK